MGNLFKTWVLSLTAFIASITGHPAAHSPQVKVMPTPTLVQQSVQSPSVQHGMVIKPPQEAYDVCTGKTSSTACSFTVPRGTVQGTCEEEQGSQTMRCTPVVSEQNQDHPRPQNY